MLTDLMQDQRNKLVQQLQDKPGYVQADVVAALALIDILEILQGMKATQEADQHLDHL